MGEPTSVWRTIDTAPSGWIVGFCPFNGAVSMQRAEGGWVSHACVICKPSHWLDAVPSLMAAAQKVGG